MRFARRTLTIALILLCAVSLPGSLVIVQASDEISSQPDPSDPAYMAVMPTLQRMTAQATSNADALARVTAYYERNRDRLSSLWKIDHETRLAATFAMYVTHISKPYGEVPTTVESLTEFLSQERAHCVTYSYAEADIAEALGLTWRMMEFETGAHTWIEVLIDGRWETFDAMSNVWLSVSMDEALLRAPRRYRMFYTPLDDPDRPEARLHLWEGVVPGYYNVPLIRRLTPCVGFCYNYESAPLRLVVQSA